MKTCTHKGCNNNQFGGGYCAYHQYIRRMRGGDLYKPKPRQSKPINKESPKGKKENKRYRDVLQEYWDNAVATKTNYCFICGEYMAKREDNHHLDGRIADKLHDCTYWAMVHRECHRKIHDYSIEMLLRESWYQDYLDRLKQRDPFLYYKELKKQDKNLEMSFE